MKTFAWALLLLLGGHTDSASSKKDQYLKRKRQTTPQGNSPIRVFVLAGQSNMLGMGKLSSIDAATGQQKNATLEWLATNVPDRFGMLKEEDDDATNKADAFGDSFRKLGKTKNTNSNKNVVNTTNWKTRQDVIIACNSRKSNEVSPAMATFGNLYPGLCAGDSEQVGRQFGPELGFGWTMGDALQDDDASGEKTKILLIKVAWGGKSLAVDFRPPSSGGNVGPYYKTLISHVRKALNNFEDIVPDELGRGFVLSGFVWHQGWNDGCNTTMSNEYETNLANLIRDVRNDLKAPDLPFAIAATGMLGYSPQSSRREEVFDAQMNIATYPEFQGKVISIDTRPFAREVAPASPSGARYHWNANAESYWLIGQSLGEAMIDLFNKN